MEHSSCIHTCARNKEASEVGIKIEGKGKRGNKRRWEGQLIFIKHHFVPFSVLNNNMWRNENGSSNWGVHFPTSLRTRILEDKDEIADLSKVSNKVHLHRDRIRRKAVEGILKFFLLIIINLNTSNF